MNSIARFYKHIPTWVTSFIVILLIAYISLDPNPMDVNSIKLFKGADKVIHFIMYFILCISLIFDYAKMKMPHHTKLSREIAFTIFAFLVGLVLEIMQATITDFRAFDIYDIVANTIGAITAFALLKLFLMHKFRKRMVPLYVKRHRHHHHSHKTK